MIVTKDMYNELREKANIEPWKSMKKTQYPELIILFRQIIMGHYKEICWSNCIATFWMIQKKEIYMTELEM